MKRGAYAQVNLKINFPQQHFESESLCIMRGFWFIESESVCMWMKIDRLQSKIIAFTRSSISMFNVQTPIEYTSNNLDQKAHQRFHFTSRLVCRLQIWPTDIIFCPIFSLFLQFSLFWREHYKIIPCTKSDAWGSNQISLCFMIFHNIWDSFILNDWNTRFNFDYELVCDLDVFNWKVGHCEVVCHLDGHNWKVGGEEMQWSCQVQQGFPPLALQSGGQVEFPNQTLWVRFCNFTYGR